MNNTTKTIAIVLTSVLFIPLAAANTPRGQGKAKNKRQKAERILQMFDKNNDRVLDVGELESMLEFRAKRKGKKRHGKMKRFDTNGDGQLDANERAAMEAAKAQRKAEALQRFDQNGNGVIDPSEKSAMHAAMAQQRFDGMLKRFDSNKDGAIALAEINAHIQAKGPGSAAGKGKGKKAKKLRKLFQAADTDKNNVLTRAEFQRAMSTLKAHGGQGKKRGSRGRGAPGNF